MRWNLSLLIVFLALLAALGINPATESPAIADPIEAPDISPLQFDISLPAAPETPEVCGPEGCPDGTCPVQAPVVTPETNPQAKSPGVSSGECRRPVVRAAQRVRGRVQQFRCRVGGFLRRLVGR